MRTNTNLVVNWHLTEACNYRCQYCYAKWDEAQSLKELIGDPKKTELLLQELYNFFRPGNASNPLWGKIHWATLRLNLAGGEPLLYRRLLPNVVSKASALGFDVSLITNASRLTENTLSALAPDLSWLGISIDSAFGKTNREIGRVDSRGHLLDYQALAARLTVARAANPNMKIKINTVVNRSNEREDFSPLIVLLNPDKWKVLRVLPVVTDALTLSDEAFDAFLTRHQRFSAILCAENNDEMRNSYLMVDPQGRFFQNGQQGINGGYTYSLPIQDVGAAAAFNQISFDPDRFLARYPDVVRELVG